MAKTGLTVNLLDTALGTQVVNNGVSMLLLPASSGAPDTMFTTPQLVTSVAGAKAIKIAAVGDYWNALDTGAQAQITEFYGKAGTGAYLWLLAYDTALDWSVEATVATLKLNIENAISATGTSSNGWAYRARLFGFVFPVGTLYAATTTGLYDLSKQLTLLSAVVYDMFAQGYRISVALDGAGMGKTTTDVAWYNNATGLTSLANSWAILDTIPNGQYGVSIVITTKDASHTAGVGEFLGVAYGLSTATSVGNMQIVGSIDNAHYFLDRTSVSGTGATSVANLNRYCFEDLGSKQYVFARTRVGNSGVFYNDGATCNESINALSKMDMVRTANLICDDADFFFQNLLNTNVPVTSSGDIESGFKSAQENAFRTKYIVPMIGQISDATISISALNGNFVSSKTLVVTIKILPAPNMEWAVINVQYVSSL